MRLVIVVPSNSTQQQCPLCIVQWEQSEIILLVSSARPRGECANIRRVGGCWWPHDTKQSRGSPASSGLGNNDATSLKHLLDGDMCHCHVGTKCQGQVMCASKFYQPVDGHGLHEITLDSVKCWRLRVLSACKMGHILWGVQVCVISYSNIISYISDSWQIHRNDESFLFLLQPRICIDPFSIQPRLR